MSEKTNQELIMEITRDKTLSTEEKNAKIKDIMLGKFKNADEIKVPDCTHYKKFCNKFKFKCCNKFYDCCRCHNQAGLCNNPIVIDTINCSKCETTQDPSNSCIQCGTQFSRSYCEICNIWSEKNIYHCEKCGLCRVGTLDKFFHCDNCQSCFKKPKEIIPDNFEQPEQLQPLQQHQCTVVLSSTTQCVLCLETAATTSQYHLMVLGCNHPVHKECLNMALKANNYKCPLCRKSMINMQYFWSLTDQEILQHPLPPEAARKRNIMCYDCNAKTLDADWHFFGIKCHTCGSYNTSTE